MKRFALALLCAGMVGMVAWAEEEEEAAPAAPAPAAAGPVVEVAADCPVCTKKVCVAEPTKTKTTKVRYDAKCVDYCVPPCPKFSLFKKKDCECEAECPTCHKPRVKHVLIKKIETCEKDTYKCVPKEVAVEPTCKRSLFSFGHKKSCDTCGEHAVEQVIPAAPAAEKLPLPKGDGKE